MTIRKTAILMVRLQEEDDKRLAKLANVTGRSKSFYMREALSACLDDLEAVYLTQRRHKLKHPKIKVVDE